MKTPKKKKKKKSEGCCATIVNQDPLQQKHFCISKIKKGNLALQIGSSTNPFLNGKEILCKKIKIGTKTAKILIIRETQKDNYFFSFYYYFTGMGRGRIQKVSLLRRGLGSSTPPHPLPSLYEINLNEVQ